MNIVKHRFTSAKSNGPDATQIQPSNWNDGHGFVGGAAGDVLARDPADAAYGAIWSPMGTGQVFPSGTTYVVLPPTVRDHVVILTDGGDFHAAVPASGTFAIGARLTIKNAASADVVLVHKSGAFSQGRLANIVTSPRATQLASARGAAVYVWDGTYWTLISHVQGRANALGLTAANLVGFTASIYSQDFTLQGGDLRIRVFFLPAHVPGSTAKLSIVGWPWTFVPNGLVSFAASMYPAIWTACVVEVAADALNLYQMNTSTPWPAADINVGFDITVPIL